MTSIYLLDAIIKPINDATLREGAAALRAGRLVAFPTETVYGLGANALDDKAVADIFAAKGRPQINPLIIHAASTDQAKSFGEFNGQAEALAEAFWPGALTLVLPRMSGSKISLLATAGLDTIAVRVPAHPAARALIAQAGVPVAAPSANKSGQISATAAAHAAEDLGSSVSMVLDDGPVTIGIESTIVACLDGQPVLLRPGAIAAEEIEKVLCSPVPREAGSPAQPQAPGQLASHYAPQATLRLNATKRRAGEALLAFGGDMADSADCLNLSPNGDLAEAAAHLFAYLRRLDAHHDSIAVMPIPHHGLGAAINDRLARAAAPKPLAR